MNETQLDGQSLDLVQQKLDQLRQLLPEIFSEGQLDLEKLRLTLGEAINLENERYVLNWAGKSDAFRVLQQPTTATLAPAPEESINFDTTQNLFVEGENLEVLKALQKAYFGQVKLIYIDPPYNTGSDHFIYPDKFAESKEEYLRRIEDKDEAGYMLKEGLFHRNSKESGHFHSNWLSMMYPRLFLARNLLREDGVIFVSIDDNEVHNLRLLMNEVFGEENFVASIIWQKKYAVSNDDQSIGIMHDYILVYQKSTNFQRNLLPRTEKQLKRYVNLDNDPRGVWSSDNYVSNKSKEERPTLYYPIIHPKTKEEVWPNENAVWRYSREQHERMVKENRLYWGPNESYKIPRLKRFLSEIQEGIVPTTWWPFEEVGHNDEAQKETFELIGRKIFTTPKPVRLLKRILEISTSNNTNDIILDFFAGSGTLAQAVIEQNIADNGNRHFICIQLPEKSGEDTTAYKTGYATIADIGKERIRRVIHKLKAENPMFAGQGVDLGFKVFKLKPSNFKIWRGDFIEDEADLGRQLALFVDPVRAGAREENMLFELMLKSGYPLTAPVEKDDGFYRIAGGELVIILSMVDEELVRYVISQRPKVCLCLDRLFQGNDQLKTNTVLQMRDAGIKFATI
jgi:adenine-specific DNA-methyltransferase